MRGRLGEYMNRERELKVMLVEDSPVDMAVTQAVLVHNKLKKHLVLATRGEEAQQILEKMAQDGNPPDLILLDLNLPDTSGIDLLTHIKDDPRFAEIPVVILTVSNEDEDIQKSYDLGASSYLVKPISNDALMLVVEKLFSR